VASPGPSTLQRRRSHCAALSRLRTRSRCTHTTPNAPLTHTHTHTLTHTTHTRTDKNPMLKEVATEVTKLIHEAVSKLEA
jgi:hypothetical protein